MRTGISNAARVLRRSTSRITMSLFIATALASVASAATSVPTRFASPEDAAAALAKATAANDVKALNALFGPAAKDLVGTGDPVADKRARTLFAAAYAEKHAVTVDGDKATLIVGASDWPTPIPIVKHGDKWSFDAKQGKQEILDRRIGNNELATIQVCLAYVDGQREYASLDRNGDGRLEYAQKFFSTPGKKDGLYWPSDGLEPSPLGEFIVQAQAEGYKSARLATGKPSPYHGYLYRMLKAQGKDARGGAMNYVVKGRMIGGFALVAYPAKYGSSGVMTFIVNHDGVVYQKDLGPNSAAVALKMTEYNPDATWSKVP